MTLTVPREVDLHEANETINRVIIGNDDTKNKLLVCIARMKLGEQICPIGMSRKKHMFKIFAQLLGRAYVETILDEWKLKNVEMV